MIGALLSFVAQKGRRCHAFRRMDLLSPPDERQKIYAQHHPPQTGQLATQHTTQRAQAFLAKKVLLHHHSGNDKRPEDYVKKWWEGQDSNLCRVSPTELQSVAFDRSATLPQQGKGRKVSPVTGGLFTHSPLESQDPFAVKVRPCPFLRPLPAMKQGASGKKPKGHNASQRRRQDLPGFTCPQPPL